MNIAVKHFNIPLEYQIHSEINIVASFHNL